MNVDQASREKIAVFLPRLAGRGANRVLMTLANGFASSGYQVDLVLAEKTGSLLDVVSSNVSVVDLGSKGGVLKCLPALARYLRTERPVVLLSAMDYINVLVLLLAKLVRTETKIFVSSHTSLLDSVRSSRRLRDRLIPMGVRWTYCWAQGVIAVSRAGADDLRRLISCENQRVRTIYNPVVDESFDRRANESLDHKWLRSGEPPVITAVGALDPRKDYPTLINAFAILRERMNARLMILGDGEERQSLTQKIAESGFADDIELVGHVDNPLPYVKASSLFVLSSTTEGFGLVLAEAMACGTPVVSTDCRFGPAEILDKGRFGRLVPTRDPAALADAMSKTMAEVPDRESLRIRGQEFSLERAVQAYLQFFELQPVPAARSNSGLHS